MGRKDCAKTLSEDAESSNSSNNLLGLRNENIMAGNLLDEKV